MDFNSFPIPDAVKPYAPLLTRFTFAILILLAGWMLSKSVYRLVKTMLGKTRTEEALARFIAAIAQYGVLAFTLITALNQVGVATASLVAVLASAGLAVGLALQGSLSNFASGVLILALRPFMLDDYVEIGGKSGTVEDIGLFMTRLVTPNNETVLVPNSQVTGSSITNFTSKGIRRCTIDIGVAYGEDARRVREVLLETVTAHEACLEEPAPAVVLNTFGVSSLDFQVRAFARNSEFWPMVNELKLRIYEVLNREGIEIPFNQIVVHQAEQPNQDGDS